MHCASRKMGEPSCKCSRRPTNLHCQLNADREFCCKMLKLLLLRPLPNWGDGFFVSVHSLRFIIHRLRRRLLSSRFRTPPGSGSHPASPSPGRLVPVPRVPRTRRRCRLQKSTKTHQVRKIPQETLSSVSDSTGEEESRCSLSSGEAQPNIIQHRRANHIEPHKYEIKQTD